MNLKINVPNFLFVKKINLIFYLEELYIILLLNILYKSFWD